MQKSRQQMASALAASHGSNQSILSNCDSYRSQTYSDASPQICPGRGEPAPLSVISGGIGSKASALVAGSPPRRSRPPAESGPGRQPPPRGARPGTHALRRNWVQGVSPGRGEPAPLPATSGGIGSRASAMVAGSPPHYPSSPADLGPGRQPWG